MKTVRAARLSVLVAALGIGASGAGAAIVEMTFTGSINSSNMTAFPLGQSVTVTLTYESSSSFQFVSNRQAFYVDAFRSISVVSGGYSASQNGAFGQINKYDNLSGFDGIQWQVAAIPVTYQFTSPKPATVSLPNVNSNALSQSFDNMFINLGGNNTIWSDYTLPTSYNVAQFDLTNNINLVFSNGGFSTGFSTVSSRIIEVPGPGVAAVMGVALLGVRRRRR